MGTDVEIEIRADSGATPRLYEFCECEENLQYVIGLSRNPRLQRVVEPARLGKGSLSWRKNSLSLIRVSLSSPQLGSIPSRHCQSGGRQRGINRRFVLPTGTISAPNHFMTTTQTEGRPRTSSRPSRNLSMDRLSCHDSWPIRLLLHALADQMFVCATIFTEPPGTSSKSTSSGPIGARTTNHSTLWVTSFLRTTPLPPRLESPQLQLAFPSSPEKPLPTLIQAQICLKFTPQTTQTSPTHILRKSACHTCPLPSWATSRVVFELRFLHNPG